MVSGGIWRLLVGLGVTGEVQVGSKRGLGVDLGVSWVVQGESWEGLGMDWEGLMRKKRKRAEKGQAV